MFKNNLKIAWRNLVKDRQFTFLNLLGLSTGLACVLLIYLWVHDELGMDKFHQNDSRLFQVMQNIPLGDAGVETSDHTPDLLAKSLKEEIPAIEDAATIKFPDRDGNPEGIISLGQPGVTIKAKEIFATPNFFNVFSFHLLEGDKDKVLAASSNVLLSDKLAMKLFNSTKEIIGKTVTWDRGNGQSSYANGTYTVSGIFEAPPANSSMQFDLLFAHDLYAEKNAKYINWNSSNPSTYLLFKKGAGIQPLNDQLRNFIKSKLTGDVYGQKWAGALFLQRYSDTYLHNHYENGIIAGGRIENVKLFSIIAVFILVIACINFMNLATARTSRRLKEVGIKKVVGASRSMLVFQFIGESILMVFLSLAGSMLLVWFLLPAFQEITGKNIVLHFNADIILSVLGITLVTGFLAGSYPALYLSRFKPVMILKGKLNRSASESFLRRGLVVFQFTISIILIVSVLVVYEQMQLIQTKNLGYNKDNIIHFANEGKLETALQPFLSEVKNLPGIMNASDMEGDMFGNNGGGSGVDWPGKTADIEFNGLNVDYDFMETMGLQMKEGRMFSRKYGTDSSGVIFNETAISAMRLKDPVGKKVQLWGNEVQIIGVVKDFHAESVYKKIAPFFLRFSTNNPNIIAKIKAGKEQETLAQLEKLYKAYNPGLPFQYTFMDNDYQALYSSEKRVAVLSKYFAGIAILISCLGLFGLAAFTAQKRQKEIGVRKVVGATVSNITLLLSKDFLKLVFIAVLIAFPVAWWVTNHWLQSFAYRIHISAGIFLTAGASVVLVTLLTISFQTLKAAIANPVKSLRTE
ncbi:MAG: ABC transporter permease [Bacteroidota bacterium]